MDVQAVDVSVKASLSSAQAFPVTVARMMAAGVERYTVDLVAGDHRVYGRDGSVHTLPLDWSGLDVAASFNRAGIQAAILDTQQGRIVYPQFLARAAAAGIASYTAYLDGRRVVYTGRLGASHTEPFPGAVLED